MNPPNNLFLVSLITIFVLSILNVVDAIKCYQCDSFDEGCSSLTETDLDSKYFQDCGNKHESPFCRKTIQTILNSNNLVRITRSCGWKTTSANTTKCFTNDTQFKLDVTCQCYKDGCNSAPALIEKSTTWKLMFISLANLFLFSKVFV